MNWLDNFVILRHSRQPVHLKSLEIETESNLFLIC